LDTLEQRRRSVAELTVRDEICEWLRAIGVDTRRVPRDAQVTILPNWIVIDTFRSGPGGGILLFRDRRGEPQPFLQKTVARRTVDPPPIVARWIAGEFTERDLWLPASEGGYGHG